MDFRGGPQTIGIVLAFAFGAFAVAAWSQGLYANVALALGAGLWLAASPLLRIPPLRLNDPVPRGRGEDELVIARAMLDQSPTPLVALEADGPPRALNRAARRLFATDAHVAAPVAEELAQPGARTLRYAGHRYRLDRAEVRGTGPARTILALADIEAVERTAEARATRDLIQVLSHEVMNALAPITSLADSARAAAAEEPPALADVREMLGTLARRAEGLQRFTDAYREMARLPAPAPELTSLHQLIDDLARLFAGRWGERVALVAEAPMADTVAIDRDQIGQALWALLQNGAEAAADTASPRVTLTTSVSATRLVFTVADTGPGLAPDTRARIFDAFYSTKPQGSGVGLSLARQIARAHGGDLTLGGGVTTTFALTLPLSI